MVNKIIKNHIIKFGLTSPLKLNLKAALFINSYNVCTYVLFIIRSIFLKLFDEIWCLLWTPMDLVLTFGLR